MGVVNFVKKQFIDILQWTEASDDVLAPHRRMVDAVFHRIPHDTDWVRPRPGRRG